MISQSHTIAKLLLDIHAVKLSPNQPFTFSSGIQSPIYCDNRILISYPQHRQRITAAFIKQIQQLDLQFDVIAGTATAGIPHAAWLAHALDKPMIYVRSKPKGHGQGNQIEGIIQPNQTALVIEDLVSTGGSVINAVQAIRAANAKVNDCLCIFSYGMQQANQAIHAAKLHCHSLTELDALLDTAIEQAYIDASDIPLIRQWQHCPEQWPNKTL